jgi:hypothetical protein
MKGKEPPSPSSGEVTAAYRAAERTPGVWRRSGTCAVLYHSLKVAGGSAGAGGEGRMRDWTRTRRRGEGGEGGVVVAICEGELVGMWWWW